MAVRGAAGAAWTRFTQSLRINVATGTAAEEFLTDLVLGFECVLEAAYFIASGDGAGASASRTLRAIKGAATVMASAAVVLADTQTKGLKKTLTNATALQDRTLGPADTLTIDLASGGTGFTTLTGNVILVFRQRRQTYE